MRLPFALNQLASPFRLFNSYIEDNILYIVPTLTNTTLTDSQILNGYTLDISSSGDGSCTSTTKTECIITSAENENVVINPVRSGRINTNGKRGIRFGKVEVEAMMPTG